MAWADMIGSTGDLPSLDKVHANLKEDGLDVERDKYILVTPEGLPVRSDRCLNYVLEGYRQRGVPASEWNIVVQEDTRDGR